MTVELPHQLVRGRTVIALTSGVLLSVLALSASGCASGLLPSSGPSASEVEALKRRVVGLQQEATVGKVEVARLRREVTRLEAELERARLAAQETSEPSEEPETTTSGAGVAPGIGYVGPEIEEMDLEEPPVEPETVSPEAAASASASEPAPAAASAPLAAVTSTEAQRLYDDGYTLFHQQSYAGAEDRFQRYVELYPQTELADNALFWVGESRFARGNYDGALEAFSTTVERFPSGNKVADALFKSGRCLESLGEHEQARSTYQEVARRYPGSAASAQARERLDALR